MLTIGSRVRPRVPETAAKVLDGEAIIINLTNGMYYSMDQAACLIWELVSDGHSLEEIASALTRAYDVSTERARLDVERIIADLLQERLVCPTDTAGPAPHDPHPAPAEKLAYATPILNKYSDLGHLLALDPPMPGLDDIPWQGPAEESRG